MLDIEDISLIQHDAEPTCLPSCSLLKVYLSSDVVISLPGSLGSGASVCVWRSGERREGPSLQEIWAAGLLSLVTHLTTDTADSEQRKG